MLGKQACLSTLEGHWGSFYTRDDFVDIQSAGLNSVRIPVGYWAVDVLQYEPYVSGQVSVVSNNMAGVAIIGGGADGVYSTRISFKRSTGRRSWASRS